MYVVVIRTKDSTVSPVVIGTFQTKQDAQDWGERFDYRLRVDQLWSTALVAIPTKPD